MGGGQRKDAQPPVPRAGGRKLAFEKDRFGDGAHPEVPVPEGLKDGAGVPLALPKSRHGEVRLETPLFRCESQGAGTCLRSRLELEKRLRRRRETHPEDARPSPLWKNPASAERERERRKPRERFRERRTERLDTRDRHFTEKTKRQMKRFGADPPRAAYERRLAPDARELRNPAPDSIVEVDCEENPQSPAPQELEPRQIESGLRGRAFHHAALARELTPLDPRLLPGRDADVHEADGLLVAAASRASDSGDGNRDVGRSALEGSLRHGEGHFFAYRAHASKEVRRDAEERRSCSRFRT